jgi:nitroreductase
MDEYQERYLVHQSHKKGQLAHSTGDEFKPHHKDVLAAFKELTRDRRSQRVFDGPVSEEVLASVLDDLAQTPSSCNRQAVSIKVVESRTEKELLSGIMVGGVGWCHRADKILLLLADPLAYKENLPYMPFLDAGVIIQQAYLSCEAHNVGCCFINPNVREENQAIFKERFSPLIFCGALAIGAYSLKAKPSPKRESLVNP